MNSKGSVFSLTINGSWRITARIKPECFISEEEADDFHRYCNNVFGDKVKGHTGSFKQKAVNGKPVMIAEPYVMNYHYSDPFSMKALEILKTEENLEKFLKDSPVAEKLYDIEGMILK